MLGRLLLAAPLLLSSSLLVQAGNDCQPITWEQGGVFGRAEPSSVVSSSTRTTDGGDDPEPTLKPGDVNCRGRDIAPKKPDYYTCKMLADRHEITVEKFFLLNPELKGDCANVKPREIYCVSGYIEPLRAYDGKCGPPNKNATCLGTAKQCCNSKTWTCGDKDEDCANGTCFEGTCPGDSIWSTDGKCGRDFGFKQCTGIQGDCCSMGGKCGTGPQFCGDGVCQLGNCDAWKTSSTDSSSATAKPTMAGMNMF